MFPIILIFNDFFLKAGKDFFLLFIAFICVFTLIYMFFDMLFGFTAKFLNRRCRHISQMTAIPRHKDIMHSFEWLKKKFDMERSVLLIDTDGDIINAYAIGGSNNQTVTLTLGLIFEIHRTYEDEDMYVRAVEGVIGHELSHLANKDFLPGLLTASSYRVNDFVANMVRIVLIVLANVLLFIPFIGWYIKLFIYKTYSLVSWLCGLFLRYAYMPIHGFLMKWFGRAIEYRCDKDSAKVVGGYSMVLGLAALGKGSYFSVFSTHPRTKSRIKKVENVRPTGEGIKPSIFNSLANGISLFTVVVVMYSATFALDWKNLETNYINEVKTPVMIKVKAVKKWWYELSYGA
jgi:Zn-dependent protease with chaperone function